MNRLVLSKHALERLQERFDWPDATTEDLADAFYRSEPAPEWVRNRVKASEKGTAVTIYGDAVFVSEFDQNCVVLATVLPMSFIRRNKDLST